MVAPPKSDSSTYCLNEHLEWSTDRLEELDYKRLSTASPAVVANFLQRLEVDQRRDVLRILREEEATDILAEMDAEDSAEVVRAMQEWRALGILEEFDPADGGGALAEEDRSRLLEKLEPSTARFHSRASHSTDRRSDVGSNQWPLSAGCRSRTGRLEDRGVQSRRPASRR